MANQKLGFSVEKNIVTCTLGDKVKQIEIIHKGLIRIYEKKNPEELVKLNLHKRKVSFTAQMESGKVVIRFGDYEIFVDQKLFVEIKKNGMEYFEEYSGDAKIYGQEKDFSLSMLEGHKQEDELVSFHSQINLRLFDKEDKIYGLGDKAAQLNKRDFEYISWNTDDPTQHNESYKSLYKSINYLMVNHHNDRYYGIFYPSSYKCVFNLGRYSDEFLYIGSEKGEYDYFVLLGRTPKELSGIYAELVGHTLFTSMKMLGYHQSRWSYNESEVLDIQKTFEKKKLPLDYIHLDIDYMERYKVYTVDSANFKDLKKMTDSFEKKGVGIITIIDPAVKVEEGYPVYDTLKKNHGFATLDGKDYVNQVWPGDSKYPNYFDRKTAEYITELTGDFIRQYGVKGIWCDMNEPASFNGPLPDEVEFPTKKDMHYHDEVHNLYGEYMTRAIAKAFEKENMRPTVITRAAFATSSPFTTTWNGDNQSLWAHLSASLPQVMTMNLSNFMVNGVDIGGFGNECTKELLIRWLEANIFSLFLRNHSAMNTRHQEPYAFDEETESIYREYLKLRYEMIPYLYDLLRQGSQKGTPVLRPLFFQYPDDPEVKDMNDEMMVGDSLLFAPILHQGQHSRVVYFPKGTWIDYFTGKEYRGGREVLVRMELSQTGLFVKKGAILPQFKGLLHIEKKKIDTLYLYVTGNNATYLHYEDDGESLDYQKGVYNEYEIKKTKEELTIRCRHDGFNTTYKNLVVLIDGKEIKVPFQKDMTVSLK